MPFAQKCGYHTKAAIPDEDDGEIVQISLTAKGKSNESSKSLNACVSPLRISLRRMDG
jgi:hypothetical protein